MRAEIETQGVVADKFLARDADCPTFGLNLACAWPFPDALRESYERMAQRFAALGSCVYVYPFAFTHVTLVTFVSFSRHVRPAPELVSTLEGKVGEILETLAPLFAENSPEQIKPFMLQPQRPVLSRAAVILPMLNPGGEVPRLRQRVLELLQRTAPLHRELTERGLTVPGIIHSTVMRFVQPPPDLNVFLKAFDEIATNTKFPAISVAELLFTTETKPYMRGGDVLRRSRLAEE
jgi:hypothetical protein